METKQKRIVIIGAVVVAIVLIVGVVLILKNKTQIPPNRPFDPVPEIGKMNSSLPPELVAVNESIITGTIEKIDSQSLQVKIDDEPLSFENIPKNLFYPVVLKFDDSIKVSVLASGIKDENSLKGELEKFQTKFTQGRFLVQPEKSQKFNITKNTFVVSIVDNKIGNKPISDLKVGMKIIMNYEKDINNALTINVQ
ncbi:MAG: hypothetical protein WCW93_03265 [Candidatus Paceibacterota bacterium]